MNFVFEQFIKYLNQVFALSSSLDSSMIHKRAELKINSLQKFRIKTQQFSSTTISCYNYALEFRLQHAWMEGTILLLNNLHS